MNTDRPTTPDPNRRPNTPDTTTSRTVKDLRTTAEWAQRKMDEQQEKNRSASQSPVKKKTKEKKKKVQNNPYDLPQPNRPQQPPPQPNRPQYPPPQPNRPQYPLPQPNPFQQPLPQPSPLQQPPPQPNPLQHHPLPANIRREDSPETECGFLQELLRGCWNYCSPGLGWLWSWFWGAICNIASWIKGKVREIASWISGKIGEAASIAWTQCIKFLKKLWKKAWKHAREPFRKKCVVKKLAAPTEQVEKKGAVKERAAITEQVKPPVVKEEKKKKIRESSQKLPLPEPETPHSPLRDTPLQDDKSDSHVTPTRRRSSSSSGYHGCSCCLLAIFGIIAIAIAIAIAIGFLLAFCRPSTPSTHQPIDVLITAADSMSSALELLTDTMQWQVHAKLDACEFVELAANVSRDPSQYPRFRKAREKDGSGWACPIPVSPPRVTTVNEKLAITGLELAEGMWNISLLLDRSSSESLVAAQQAVNITSRIRSIAINSKICRVGALDTFPPKALFSLLPCLAMPDPTFATLNDAIAHLNSTLTSFAASHISLLTDLGNTATTCQTRLARLVKVPFTQQRGKDLVDSAEMVCNLFAKDVERGLSSSPLEKPPFFEAKSSLDEALSVLQNITASGWELRQRASFDWINQRGRASTTTGDITAADLEKQQQRRCRVLGALGSPKLKGYDNDGRDDETATLEQTFRKWEKWALQAGTLMWLGDMRQL